MGSASFLLRPASRFTWLFGVTQRDLDRAARRLNEGTMAGLGPSAMYVAFKGLADRIAALLGLVLLAPVFLAIALAVRLESPGPIFFRQIRVGRYGELFTIVKFRTMDADAEEREAEVPNLDLRLGPLFGDPRITRVGAVLRRSSLDKLPQLFNVVNGSMSLVGPRPCLTEEIEVSGDSLGRRLTVKPGMTGLSQVSGRSNLSFDEAVRVDIYYVEHQSLWLDLTILWRRTVGALLRPDGAP